MYTSKIPIYTIDLELPEKDRWAHVISKEKETARPLVEEATGGFKTLKPLASRAFEIAYRLFGGRYLGEVEAWADALGVAPGEVLLANCGYELEHFSWVYGCTAGVRHVPGHGLTLVRNLDWAMDGLGKATRIFRFTKKGHEFVTVGIAGCIGVLSGMVPRKFAIALNWAPPRDFPRFSYGPTFLLREVLEECKTYEDAVYRLKRTEMSTSAFFTVCGAEEGQACVIERTRKDASVRSFEAPVLVQANHYVSQRFRTSNAVIEKKDKDGDSFIHSSFDRARILTDELSRIDSADSLDDVADCLDAPEVLNEDTHQQMVFCPKTGKYKAWRMV